MEFFGPLLVVLIILLFGTVFYFLVRHQKAQKTRKTLIARELGFAPIEPDEALSNRIFQIYEKKWGKTNFELTNVFHKRIPDGDMYLFDLINTAGEEDSLTEEQAIALVSRYLKLPKFTLFPQLVEEGVGVNFANRILRWVVTKAGDPVDFTGHPDFQERYLVSSPEEDKTRQFLDDRKLHLLSQLHMTGIHAGGDMFVLSRFFQENQSLNRDQISKRISNAMDIFQIFTD